MNSNFKKFVLSIVVSLSFGYGYSAHAKSVQITEGDLVILGDDGSMDAVLTIKGDAAQVLYDRLQVGERNTATMRDSNTGKVTRVDYTKTGSNYSCLLTMDFESRASELESVPQIYSCAYFIRNSAQGVISTDVQ